jgi:AcrR family transcriptional regulator
MLENGEETKGGIPRAEARRRQVIDAAAKCFRRDGFHSASMAQIAAEAGMSVGHIYRYFTGKESIIAAIVRDEIDYVLSRFPITAASIEDVPGILRENGREAVRQAYNLEWSTLMLEVRAEAGRNPAVAAIVQAADAEIAARVGELIVAGFVSGTVPRDIEQRIEMLGMAIEGITFRAVACPDMNPRYAEALIDLVIDNIFAPELQSSGGQG